MTLPAVASATLHPAPPESYTVFMAGCNYKCLNCQNWTIAQTPDNGYPPGRYVPARELARECVTWLESLAAQRMGADRIFFSGGEPTIHLPYVEAVVAEARRRSPDLKVNFDTNGYLTHPSLLKVLEFTTSITFDLKAFSDEVHLALTGAPSTPVLRNAAYVGKYAKEKLWAYRILVIPEINVEEIAPLCRFIAGIDVQLPVCFLAFRPNYVLEHRAGATADLMDRCVDIAVANGLRRAHWAGQAGIPGLHGSHCNQVVLPYRQAGARAAGTDAYAAGCLTHPRNCVACTFNQSCAVKGYVPRKNS
jgi:pyruvate formate lyase activating enzyme